LVQEKIKLDTIHEIFELEVRIVTRLIVQFLLNVLGSNPLVTPIFLR